MASLIPARPVADRGASPGAIQSLRLLLALAALAGLGLQVPFLATPLLNVDEAIEGLAARAILRGELPVFFYGQAHMGTLGVYALAALSWLLGSSAFTLKLSALSVFGLFAASLWRLGTRLGGASVGTVTLLLVLLPAPYLFEWSHEARTHYTLVLVLGTLLLGVGHALLATPSPPPRRWLALGLLAGLGLWTSFFSLFYLLPVGLAVIARWRRRLLGGSGALAAGGFFLGSTPFWGFNLTHAFGSFELGVTASPTSPLEALTGFAWRDLPALTATAPLPGGMMGVLAAAAVLMAVGGLGWAAWQTGVEWRRRSPGAWGGMLLLGVTAVTLAAALTSYGQDPRRIVGAPGPLMAEGRLVDPRYTLPLYSILPLAEAAALVTLSRRHRLAGLGLLVGLLAIQGGMDLQLATGATGQRLAGEAAAARDEAVHRWLLAHRVEAAYTPRWPSLYAFRWGPGLAVADPYQEIYPPLARRVDAASRVAFLWPVPDPHWSALLPTLAAAGIGYRTETVAGWQVHWDFALPPPTPALARDGWRARASVHPPEAALALDGDLTTRWSTGRGQRPGDQFTLDLGRPQVVTGVRWLPGSYREVPAGIRLEGSMDGVRWRPLAEAIPYLGPTFTAGPHPFVRLDGPVELRFPPTDARLLRLTQLGEARAPWSIRELAVLAPPPAAAPARDIAALADTLGRLGVSEVYADPWLGAALETARPERLRGLTAVGLADPYGRHLDPSRPHRIRWRSGAAIVVPEALGDELQAALRRVGVRGPSTTAGGFVIVHDLMRERLGPPLARTDWRVTATHRPEDAVLAIDDRPDTRWGTGVAQRPGMAFTIDLGRVVRIGGVSLDTRSLPGDAPRGLRLEVSADGQSWEEVRLQWRGAVGWTGWTALPLSEGVVSYGFAPRVARAVRLSLTSASEVNWWSIYELRLYAP